MEKKEFAKRPYKTFEREAKVCRDEWNRVLPWIQQVIDEGAKIGIEITNELISDLVNFKGRATISLLHENAERDAKLTGIKDPQVLRTLIGNPAQRAEAMLKAADMVLSCLNTSFVPQPLRGSQSLEYLTIQDGKAVLTDESFQRIVEKYFTAYVEDETQEKIFELAEQAAPLLTEIHNILTGFYDNVKLTNIFQYDASNKRFELDPFILTFTKIKTDNPLTFKIL
jgi:hypothetical protein